MAKVYGDGKSLILLFCNISYVVWLYADLVKEDPIYMDKQYFPPPPPRPKNATFEDEEKSKVGWAYQTSQPFRIWRKISVF